MLLTQKTNKLKVYAESKAGDCTLQSGQFSAKINIVFLSNAANDMRL